MSLRKCGKSIEIFSGPHHDAAILVSPKIDWTDTIHQIGGEVEEREGISQEPPGNYFEKVVKNAMNLK